MNYLTLEEILAIHHQIIQTTGGSPGILNLELLLSALSRPQASFNHQLLYPTIFDQAAALLQSLALNHPFTDGNKRTAFAAIVRFLYLNHYQLKISPSQIIKFLLSVQSQKINLEQISKFLESHSCSS